MLPDPFDGASDSRWEQWIYHFDNITTVINWSNEARERLALNGYLTQLDHLQVAFRVKQKNPDNLDAAVTATLELETYVKPKSGMLSISSITDGAEDDEATMGAVCTADKLATLEKKLVERLESGQTGTQPPEEKPYQSGKQHWVTRTKASSRATRGDFMCWNCHKPEHIARNCRMCTETQTLQQRQETRVLLCTGPTTGG